MDKINILIVEDNEDHLFFIKKALTDKKYVLQRITSGTEAYNYLLNPKTKPDIVLLDNHLPGMSGLEILKKLGSKKNDYGFIVTTVDKDPEIVVDSMRAGALDFSPKTPEHFYILPQKIEKVIKILRDRSEKIQLKKVLETQQKALETAEEIAKLGSFTLDLITYKGYISKSFKNITGFLEDRGIDFHKDWRKIVHPNDVSSNQKALEKAFKTGVFNHTYRIITLDTHQIKWIQSLGKIEFKNKKPLTLIGTIQDITERKKLERALFKKSQYLTENLKQTPLAAIYTDTQMCIREWNLAAEKIFGYSKNEALGANLFELLVPKNLLPEIKTVRQNVLNETSGRHYQNRNKTKAGYEIICNWFNAVIKDENKKAVGFACLVEDVTDSLEIEKALKNSENRFRNAILKSPNPLMIHDEDNNVLQISKGWTNYSGYTLKDIPTISEWSKKAYGEKSEFAQEYIDKLFTIKETKNNGEWFVKDKNGTIHNWQFHTTPLGIFNNKKILLSSAFDITERKKAELKLLKAKETIVESEKKYRHLFERNHAVMLIIDPVGGTITDANPAACNFYGWTKEELISKKISDINTLSQKAIQEEMNLAKSAKQNYFNFEHRLANGQIHQVEVYSTPVKVGDKILLHTIVNDITQLKLAEIALRKTENRLGSLYKNAPLAYQSLNEKGYLIEVNKTWLNILGFKRQGVINKHITEFLAPESKELFKKQFPLFKASGKLKNVLFKMVKKDGSTITISINGNISRDDSGKFKQTYCNFIDVSQLKKQELTKEVIYNITKKASENNDLSILFNFIRIELSQLIDTTNFFIALYDKKTDLISTPYMVDDKDNSDDFPKGKSLTGYIIDSKKSLIGSRSKFNKLVKEGKITILGPLSKSWVGVPLLAGQEAIGAIVIQSYTEKNAYSQEEVALLELIASNISTVIKQKQDFEAIKQSDIILNKIESSILVGGLGGDIHYISPHIEKLLGYKPSELLGQKWWQMTFFDKGEIKKRQDILDQFILKGIAIKNQFITRKAKTKNGRFKWVEWHISKGIGNTFISIGIDVTEKYRQDNLNNIIYNITKKANEALPKELFFDFIRLQLSKLIDTTNFYIALGNEDSEFLTIPYMIDEKDTKDDFLKKNSLSGYVIDTKSSLLLKNSDKKILKIKEQGPPSSCWLGVPLIIKNKVIGVITVQSYTDENAYTIEDVRLLELVANSISQVIKQSQDFEQINLLSHALIQSDEGVIITNIKGDIQYVNPAFTKLSAYTEKEVLGQNPRFLKSGKQALEYYENLWDTILSGKIWIGEFVNKRKDGTHYLVHANISPIKNDKGKITHFVGIEGDITEKRKLERDFLHAFIDAQEVEKQNFGEELHDGVSQILSAQTMFVDVLKTLLKNADAKVLKHLNTVKKLNTQAINETRSIAHGLMSKQLKESGLIVAVEQICNDYNTSRDINFSFSCKGIKEQEINAEIKSNIFRIIQEVSTNTVRHAVAKKAQIKLSKTTNNQLKVVVKDNGIGIDFERMKENKKGAGLENIKRRIKLLNGTIDLKTALNKGTQYTFRIPLDNIQ